jgi:hypothetical protein
MGPTLAGGHVGSTHDPALAAHPFRLVGHMGMWGRPTTPHGGGSWVEYSVPKLLIDIATSRAPHGGGSWVEAIVYLVQQSLISAQRNLSVD